MNGLQITNNTVNVTGSATTLGKIRGIWENSAAYGSTITVSGNQYNGFAPTAGTDTIAFRVTSHSTATGTVTYSGNTAQGANIGFQWSSDLTYTGLLPIQLTNNT